MNKINYDMKFQNVQNQEQKHKKLEKNADVKAYITHQSGPMKGFDHVFRTDHKMKRKTGTDHFKVPNLRYVMY